LKIYSNIIKKIKKLYWNLFKINMETDFKINGGKCAKGRKGAKGRECAKDCKIKNTSKGKNENVYNSKHVRISIMKAENSTKKR